MVPTSCSGPNFSCLISCSPGFGLLATLAIDATDRDVKGCAFNLNTCAGTVGGATSPRLGRHRAQLLSDRGGRAEDWSWKRRELPRRYTGERQTDEGETWLRHRNPPGGVVLVVGAS